MQREAKKQMQETGIGTKSQQALKLQQEQNKQERKVRSREKKEADELRMFELKQQKKREKHRGHQSLGLLLKFKFEEQTAVLMKVWFIFYLLTLNSVQICLKKLPGLIRSPLYTQRPVVPCGDSDASFEVTGRQLISGKYNRLREEGHFKPVIFMGCGVSFFVGIDGFYK